MKYHLDVSIEPSKHYLHVKGRIENACSSTFYLNENFTVLRTSSNGQSIAFFMDKEQPHPPFDMVSRPISFDTPNDTIEFEYEGVIAGPIAEVNQIDEHTIELVWANIFYTEKYGTLDTGSGTEIISVFRPNGGWGYKRGNASFVSADWGRADRHYQGDFHELAHGWWSIADVIKEDWINEGGAEFSAFSATQQLYGPEYAEKKYGEYLAEIEKSDCNVSIVDTDNLSEYRYLNHYIKTTVMLVNAQKAFGEDRVFALLRDVFQKYKGNRNAATAGFLSLCGDMRPFFEKYLFAVDWGKLDYHVRNRNGQ